MNKQWGLPLSWLIMILVLIGCGSNDADLTRVTDDRAEEAEQFVGEYKEKMVEAYRTGNFNGLEPYLITNNSFYHSLRRYVTDSHSEGNEKELLLFEVQAVYEDDEGELYVDAIEKVEITEHGNTNEVERDVRFELTKGGNDSLRIVTIRQMNK
jgi:hypothetical protein